MLFKPLLGTDLSGKVGGLVASHNSGGAYFRAATIPTNPNTVFQQAVRTAVSAHTAAWQSSLTQAERDAWILYADNVTLTNRIGEQHNVSGLAMFIRTNVPRSQAGLARQDVAPAIFNLSTFSNATAGNASAAIQDIDIGFDSFGPTDPWVTTAGSFLLAYVSRPQNSGIEFFKGPYRFVGALQGDPVPPVSPFTIPAPFAYIEGQRLFTFCRVVENDGRLTSIVRSNTLAVA